MCRKLFLLFGMLLFFLGGCANQQRKGITVFIPEESISQEKMRSLDGNIVVSYVVYRETDKGRLETISLNGGKTIFVTNDTRRIFMDLKIQNKTGVSLAIEKFVIDENGNEIKKEFIGRGRFNGFSLIIDFPVQNYPFANQIKVVAGNLEFKTEKIAYAIRRRK